MIYQDILDKPALERYKAELNARARSCNAHGRLDIHSLRDRIMESRGRCEWCGGGLVQSPFELDHVVSLKHGGANTASNLAVACPACNRRKGQKHPARFAAEIYSSTGRRTDLVDRILRQFKLEPREQMSLFADEKPQRAHSESLDVDGQPHYRW